MFFGREREAAEMKKEAMTTKARAVRFNLSLEHFYGSNVRQFIIVTLILISALFSLWSSDSVTVLAGLASSLSEHGDPHAFWPRAALD